MRSLNIDHSAPPVYERTPRHIIIPSQSYLFYLLSCMRMHQAFGIHGAVYGDIDIAQRAKSISCRVDLSNDTQDPALGAYTALCQLRPDLASLHLCFPLVKHLSLYMTFRLLGPKTSSWMHKVFNATVVVPLDMSPAEEPYPVEYTVCFDTSDQEILNDDAQLREDLSDLYLAVGGPKPSNLRSPHALTSKSFPCEGISSLRISPRANRSQSQISFRSRHWDNTSPWSCTLDTVLIHTSQFQRFHRRSCIERNPVACVACILWMALVQVVLQLLSSVEVLTDRKKRIYAWFA